ncbi:E2F-associated phosphoprotein-domain-containing protein [Gongronella butleri]|nr:E2F-associated phosphoprotein-domain-containing protein [Gongronella butleri]
MSRLPKKYDDVYFDSDEEKETQEREQPPNDDLLYDPSEDEADEQWMAEQIKRATPKEQQRKDTEAKTDAILTCPMCFSPLCYSCQRHESYGNQFRAMFVTNCKVNKSERFRYAKDDDDAYYKVLCDTCDTHVAMMDLDEVYHFFNVIAS